jgi:hypothetical protein
VSSAHARGAARTDNAAASDSASRLNWPGLFETVLRVYGCFFVNVLWLMPEFGLDDLCITFPMVFIVPAILTGSCQEALHYVSFCKIIFSLWYERHVFLIILLVVMEKTYKHAGPVLCLLPGQVMPTL